MAFASQIRDSAGSFNASFSLQAADVGKVFGKAIPSGASRLKAKQEAEEGWAQPMTEKVPPLGTFYADCTPGYLNNEGDTQRNLPRAPSCTVVESWN